MLSSFHYARTMCEALREGLTASRHYEHLRSRGVAHKRALNKALGIDFTLGAQVRTEAPLLPTTKGFHEGGVQQNNEVSGKLSALISVS
jgi:hypothetical protein